jgi:lipopolysaccharide biosynthesis glycosyltransferase
MVERFLNKKNSVNVVLSSDSNYEQHLWVTIYTILQNAKSNKKYNIYILDGGIKHKEYFYKLIEVIKDFIFSF